MKRFFTEIKARFTAATPTFFKKVAAFKATYVGIATTVFALGFSDKLPDWFTQWFAISAVVIYVLITLLESWLPVIDYTKVEEKIKEDA